MCRCDERKMSVERRDVGREEKWRLRNEEREQEMSRNQRKGKKGRRKEGCKGRPEGQLRG